MKIILRLIVLVAFSVLQFSCKTTDTIKISGIPDTEIYTPDMKKIGTINKDGNVEVKISRDNYYPFLMSRTSDSNDFVPFALDYKKSNFRLKSSLGYTLEVIGLGAIFGSIVPLVDGSVGSGAAILTVGALSIATSCWLLSDLYGMPAMYNYKYLPETKTNQDFKFANFIDNGYIKNIENQSITNKENPVVSSASKENVSKFSKPMVFLKDHAKQVEGVFVGSGNLMQYGEIVERFEGVRVILKRSNKNKVLVDVKTKDGLSFFSSEISYNIKKSEDNGWMLNMQDMPAAQIQINTDMSLQFYHPEVNIDGDIYTLEISADKR